MNREIIEELVNEKKLELNKEYEKDYRYDYFKEYLENNELKRIEDFINIDIWHCMKCLYYLNGSEKTIEEIDEAFESFKTFFEVTDPDNIHDFMQMTLNVKNAGNLDNVIDFLKGKNFLKNVMNVSTMIQEDLGYYKTLKDLKRTNAAKDIDLVSYFECYKEQGDPFLRIIAAYRAYRTLTLETEFVETDEEFAGLREKDRNYILKRHIKEHYDHSQLFKDISRIRTFVDEEDRKEKQFIKNNNKELYNLDKAIELLDKGLEQNEITNAREIVSKIKDLNIKYSILELISEHNKKHYKEVDEELEYLNQNNKIKYQALLNDYGIINGSYQIDKIMHNRLEDVEEILKIITKYKLSNEQIIKILRNSNLEIVNKIKEYLEKGYLSLEFLIDNNDIFYKNSTKYEVYNNNIELLNEYNINPCLFFDSIKILFMNNDTFKKNIELLNSYNLLNSLKTTNNYKFLSNNELYISIDKLIELGYESFLEEDLNLLNSDKLLRLEALKAFEIIIDNKEDLDKVLTKKFYISDNELYDYIPNVESLINEDIDIDIEELNKYINGRTYNINGVIISTNKVKRNIENGLTPFKSIIKNSVLSIDEIKIIKDELKEKTLRKENI